MTSKTQATKKIEVYCSELGRYAYEVRRGDRTDFGKLVPKPGSHHQETDGTVDVLGAFTAWMTVLSRYRDWKEARDAARLLQLKAAGEPIGLDATRLRRQARPLSRRTSELDNALRLAAEDHGDLGVGQDIETIANKLIDLQNFLSLDREVRNFVAQGPPLPPWPAHLRKALEIDGRTVVEAVRGMRKVRETVEGTSHTFHHGRLVVRATYMYEAIVIGAGLAAQHPKFHLRLCLACRTLFIAKYPRASTCSDRCRQRLREQQKRTSRKRA